MFLYKLTKMQDIIGGVKCELFYEYASVEII